MSSPIIADKFFVSKTIEASGSESYVLPLERSNSEGFFSLQIAVTGDGTLKGEYQVSNDGVTYVEPTGATDIFSGFTKTSGPGADGKDLFSFSPPLALFVKIVLTETGGGDSVVATAIAAAQ